PPSSATVRSRARISRCPRRHRRRPCGSSCPRRAATRSPTWAWCRTCHRRRRPRRHRRRPRAMLRLPPLSDLFAAALVLLLAPSASAAEPRDEVGLFTTLPLYWREADAISELIGPEAASPWARAAIERDYELVPLDALAGEGAILNGLARL